jgi:hypothetical protein
MLIDCLVHFVKANGLTRAKNFKPRQLVLAPGARMTLATSISLRRMTTRRRYPGRHRIDVLMNGGVQALKSFDVC